MNVESNTLSLVMAGAMVIFAAVAALFAPAHGTNNFRQRCLSFVPEHIVANSTRSALEFVAKGTTIQFPDNVASCGRPSQKVNADICRIALHIKTSKRSEITFELWLPEQWKGERFLGTGNGGIDGCVKYEDLAYGVEHNFASMGTNNGHNGTTGVEFYNNLDVLQDYAYRSLHTGAISGKQLVRAFYYKPAAHSYYIGCSLGGRMGVKAAEQFPDDFEGIVAGCPAVDFNHLQGQRAMFYPITGPVGSKDYISHDLWKGLIHDEVLRQCDLIDGVEDGIIEIANRCHFVPEVLLCHPHSKSGTCLNWNQVQQLKKIYAPYIFPNGTLIYPRMNPGNEQFAVQKLLAGAPFAYSQDWFRYVVLNDPNWDAINYNSTLAALADEENPFNIRTWPDSLPGFKARGGKMIAYHGGQDNQITAFNTERFWSRMATKSPNLHDYFRFFRISGMYHCNQGPGAWVFGQGGGAPATGIPFDPEHNVLAAIVAWVEHGRAPETITGTKFVNDTVQMGADFTRRHCLYPKHQTYIGGDHKQPSSWRCL